MQLFYVVFSCLLQADALQQKSSTPELTQLSTEKVWMDNEDYSSAVRKFVSEIGSKGISDPLKRFSLSSVNEYWQKIQASGKHEDDARNALIHDVFNSMPVIIPNTSDQLNWPARERWKADPLKARLGKWEVAEYNYGYRTLDSQQENSQYRIKPPIMETLAKYMDRTNTGGNHLLFINEAWDSFTHPSEMRIADMLKDDWAPRPVFAYPPGSQHTLMFPEHIAVGHAWHFHGQVFHTQVVGRKLWHLLPPTHPEETSLKGLVLLDGTHVFVPNTCAYVSGKATPPNGTITVLTHPGDTLVLPTNWWHATCALDTWTMGAGTWLTFQDVPDDYKANRIARGW